MLLSTPSLFLTIFLLSYDSLFITQRAALKFRHKLLLGRSDPFEAHGANLFKNRCWGQTYLRLLIVFEFEDHDLILARY